MKKTIAIFFFIGLILNSPALHAAQNKTAHLFLSDPILKQNPNPRVPLAAILNFSVIENAQVSIQITADYDSWTQELTAEKKKKLSVPIVGLRANTDYKVVIRLKNLSGRKTEQSKILTYTTPSLPSDSREWPSIETIVKKTDRLEPGITILSLRRRTPGRGFMMTPAERKFTEEWGMLIGLDQEGEVVWYYKSPVRIGGIEQLSNGNILFHRSDFSTVEIDALGNTVRKFYPEKSPFKHDDSALPIKGIQTLHHQPHETSRKTFLAFSANEKVIENYYTSQIDINAPRKTQKVMGDTVIEFDSDGNILWEWDTFENLDPFRVGYDFTDPYWWVRGFPNALDWTHGNGVGEDVSDDSVVLYLKHQDAAIKVDRKSKEIKWIFGEPTDWPEYLQDKLLKKDGDFKWPYHAHNPRVTFEGTIMMYENGQWGARPFTGKEPVKPNDAFSRAAEYKIDMENMTVKEIWTSAKQKSEDTCHAPGMGDAHLLPKTKNVLVFDPVCIDQTLPLTYRQKDFSKRHVSEVNHYARIREYSRTMPAEIFWEILLRDTEKVLNWQVYGGFKTTRLGERNFK